jgi:hypothetical protein
LRWISQGYDIPFLRGGGEPPPWEQHNRKGAEEYAFFLEETLPELVRVGAVRPVAERPHGVSPLNVVPKSTEGKYWLILDLRFLNEHLAEFTFTMETLSRRRHGFERNDWMFNLDLQSGYFHVPVREEDQKYLGFQWGGQYYVFCVLPFGLSSAPLAFTKVMKQLANHWRRQGIRLLVYLDDWCFMHQSREEAAALLHKILFEMDAAGLLINKEKSVLIPAQRVKLLGFWIDSVEGSFRIPHERKAKILEHVEELSQGRSTGARRLASTAGRIMSCSLALGPATRIFTRDMYQCIESRNTWRGEVRLTAGVREEAALWMRVLEAWDGAAIRPTEIQTPIVLRVDASDSGWGGWREGPQQLEAHELFTEDEAATSSTHREMLGLERLLKVEEADRCRANDQLKDTLVFTDSFNTHLICDHGSSKPDLNEIAKRVFLFCVERSIRLEVRWVPREENIRADELSKLVSSGDWYLRKEWFQHLDHLWGPHTIDRMAKRSNAQVAVFNSKWHCNGSAAVDSFTQDWRGEVNWVCPNFHHVERVLVHARSCKATITVVVPVWKAAPWWGILCQAHQWTAVVQGHCILPEKAFVAEHASAMLGNDPCGFEVVALHLSFA